MNDHSFCRILHSQTLKDVKKVTKSWYRGEFWAWTDNSTNRCVEIHSGSKAHWKIYRYTSSCCQKEAYFKWWCEFLETIGAGEVDEEHPGMEMKGMKIWFKQVSRQKKADAYETLWREEAKDRGLYPDTIENVVKDWKRGAFALIIQDDLCLESKIS